MIYGCFKQTWNLSKSLHRQGFSRPDFTQKCVNLNERKLATKQSKWWVKFNEFLLYLASIIYSCVNNPGAACKMLKLFIYSVNLFWLTLPPVFVHRQEQIVTKIVYVFPKILPKSIEFYTGMPVVHVTNSMSGFMLGPTDKLANTSGVTCERSFNPIL